MSEEDEDSTVVVIIIIGGGEGKRVFNKKQKNVLKTVARLLDEEAEQDEV